MINPKMDSLSESMDRISEKELPGESFDIQQLSLQLTRAVESLEKTINLHCNLLLRNSVSYNQPRMRTNSVISTMDNMLLNECAVGKVKDKKVRERRLISALVENRFQPFPSHMLFVCRRSKLRALSAAKTFFEIDITTLKQCAFPLQYSTATNMEIH